jgi:hypothetical protein
LVYEYAHGRSGITTSVEIAGDVVASGSALAGLILVYLGGVASSYASFDADAQSIVRARFRFKAWFAFAGVVLSIAAVGAALVAKWVSNECLATGSIVFLLVALVWGITIAALSALEIA